MHIIIQKNKFKNGGVQTQMNFFKNCNTEKGEMKFLKNHNTEKRDMMIGVPMTNFPFGLGSALFTFNSMDKTEVYCLYFSFFN